MNGLSYFDFKVERFTSVVSIWSEGWNFIFVSITTNGRILRCGSQMGNEWITESDSINIWGCLLTYVSMEIRGWFVIYVSINDSGWIVFSVSNSFNEWVQIDVSIRFSGWLSLDVSIVISGWIFYAVQ